MAQRLKSETVVVQAPLSFTGSAKRIAKITHVGNAGVRIGLLWPLAILLITIAWFVVLIWYCLFGLLLVPYRLIRRGSRKEKRDRLRHQELLQTMAQQQQPPRPLQPGERSPDGRFWWDGTAWQPMPAASPPSV